VSSFQNVIFQDHNTKGISKSIYRRKSDRQQEDQVDPKVVSNICFDNREISVKCLLSSLAEKNKTVQKPSQVIIFISFLLLVLDKFFSLSCFTENILF